MILPTHRQWLVPFMSSVAVLVMTPGLLIAQESKSAALAKELAQLMDQGKMNTVAAKDPGKADAYVAAMYFSGNQPLVVSARYAVPMYMDERIGKKDYMEAYIDLNSASVPESKIFVSDLQADGLQARPEEGQPFDTYESGGTTMAFDRNWKKKNLSEEDYMAQFAGADQRYAIMLSVLVAHLKKS